MEDERPRTESLTAAWIFVRPRKAMQVGNVWMCGLGGGCTAEGLLTSHTAAIIQQEGCDSLR